MSDTLAQNPYAAPGSALQEQHGNQVPSIEEALSRGYDFSIGGLLSESWGLLKGTKGIIRQWVHRQYIERIKPQGEDGRDSYSCDSFRKLKYRHDL